MVYTDGKTYDMALVSRKATILAHRVAIISEQNIKGMTGGALDNNEAAPSPIMMQGDYSPVEFNILETMPILN